jgi:hypothetical protein
VITAANPRAPGRPVTLNPLELGASSGEACESVSPEVGCVDWYLYPINRKVRPTAGSRSAPRGGAAAPGRENPSA